MCQAKGNAQSLRINTELSQPLVCCLNDCQIHDGSDKAVIKTLYPI